MALRNDSFNAEEKDANHLIKDAITRLEGLVETKD